MTHSLRVVAVAALFALACAPAAAGAAPMTLADAVRYAIAHSPQVASAQATVSQNQANYVKTRSQSLPSVTGSLQNTMQKSSNYSGYQIIGVPQASVYSQNTAQIGTAYTYNGGLAHYQNLVAKQQLEQSQSDLRKVTQQLVSTVTTSYDALAAKRELVRLDGSNVRYQQALVRVARVKEQAGVAAGVDVLSAQAAQEKAQYTLDADTADAENARESLAQTIGAPLETAFAVPAVPASPPLPSKPIDELVRIAQLNRPEVVSAQEGVTIAQINRRSADTDLWPQIQTFASFGNQFSPTAAAFSPVPIARGTPGFWQMGVTSSITLPFVDWGARHANHVNLDNQIAAARSNLQAQSTQVEIDVRQAYRAATTALEQQTSAQDETRYSVEAARIARLQYENGLKTLTDVLAAQQQALSAQTDLFNARAAYVDAIVKLRVALGTYTPQSAVADLGGGAP